MLIVSSYFPSLIVSEIQQMSLKSLFGTNKDLEIEGVWLDISTNEDESVCRFKLARMAQSNKRYAKKMAAKGKTHRGKSDRLPQEKLRKDLIEVFSETILLDWENVVDFHEGAQDAAVDGKQVMLPYSFENAVWLLTQLPDLFDMLAEEASKLENFQTEANEAEAKNSNPSSDTH